jgi:penicillin-binding protein 1C
VRILRRALRLSAAALTVVTLSLAIAVYGWQYPVDKLRPDGVASLRVVDRDGRLLRESARAGGGRAAWVPLSSLPPLFVAATIAGEDRRFFLHHGVDGGALLRAAWLDLAGARLGFGGSTITMQLVRLVEPHPRTLLQKVAAAVRAWRLERAVDKRRILEQYVNRAYYGAGAWGVEAAAQQFFGKPAAQLSDGEAVLLATLPRAPSAYDLRAHLPAALARRHHLLQLLVDNRALDDAARARIEATPIALATTPPTMPMATTTPLTTTTMPTVPIMIDPHVFAAPHFVDWVLARVPDDVRARGGVVRTTLDLPLQTRAEALVREHVRGLGGSGVAEAGAVILDAATGEVRALVGSPDYFAPRGQIDIATTPRNPGSALKPFTYALAMEQGDSPASIAFDVDLPGAQYHPRNADGRQHGPVRYRQALACSYNLAAVQVAERVGVGALVERLRAAGLGALDGAESLGPAVTLGAAPVALVDLAAAYTFVVDGGVVHRARAVTAVEPAGDALRAVAAPPPSRIFSPEVSWLVMDMLADADARRPAFGDDLPVDLPFAVAAKTGTSGGFSDNVAVLATRQFIVAAWAGNFDGRPMHQVMAMWGAAPLGRALILAAADGRALTLPPRPPGVIARPVCALSGAAPGSSCPRRREWFVAGSEPPRPCQWHAHDAVAWPREVSAWAARAHTAGGQRAN